MRILTVTNWNRWQSYRSDRGQPPWIKIHRVVLRNPEWTMLSDAQRGHLVQIWILAADKDGRIEAPDSTDLEMFIKRVCCMESKPDLQVFESMGFIKLKSVANSASRRRQRDASVTPRPSHSDASVTPQSRVETEKSRVETEKRPEAVFAHWNSHDALTRHKSLTPKMRSSIQARIKAGYSEADLCQAITRYAELCQLKSAPGHNHWGLGQLMSRDEGEWIDRMLDPNYQGIDDGKLPPGHSELSMHNARVAQDFLQRRGLDEE